MSQLTLVDLIDKNCYLRFTLNLKVKNFVTIRLFKTFDRVTYYTFIVEGKQHSETDAFFTRYENEPALATDLNLLVAWIQEIGESRGAKDRYFRFENDASALPPPARIMAELGNRIAIVNYACTAYGYLMRLSS